MKAQRDKQWLSNSMAWCSNGVDAPNKKGRQKKKKKKFLAGCSLPRYATRTAPHGASRLVQAMSAWSVKTGRAPSRRRRDARVHGYTTTAMHNNEYNPPLLAPLISVAP